MTSEGDVVIIANTYRTQEQNRKDARERLAELIRQAATVPKRRRPTKPTKGSKERRLEGKRRRADVKKGRGGVGRQD